VLDLLAHQKLWRFVMKFVLPRQYKDLKPAQQALRQHQAPHHAGLFLLWAPDCDLPQRPGKVVSNPVCLKTS
jgi:hypothetical protein